MVSPRFNRPVELVDARLTVSAVCVQPTESAGVGSLHVSVDPLVVKAMTPPRACGRYSPGHTSTLRPQGPMAQACGHSAGIRLPVPIGVAVAPDIAYQHHAMSSVAVERPHSENDVWTDGEVTMRVLVSEFMSLDGVVQAPGGATEDTSGGFRHGGWSVQYFDPEVMGGVVDEFAERSEVLLQGRRTYQVSAAAWPERGGDPFSDWINAAQKYVVSDTLTEEDLTWTPTTIVRGAELVNSVAALREKPGGDIYVYGSLSVVRTLLAAGLVDELVLMIEPITLGGGKTLFPTDGEARRFELISAQTAATGVQVCRYRPAH